MWASSVSSPLKHFLESINPKLTSYKINYPWSEETVKSDLLGLAATILRCFRHKYISVGFFFLYLVRYSEGKDEGWKLQSVHSETWVTWPPFILVHSLWSKLLPQVAQPERKKCSKSKHVMASWWEMCICELHLLEKFKDPLELSHQLPARENPSSQLSYNQWGT